MRQATAVGTKSTLLGMRATWTPQEATGASRLIRLDGFGQGGHHRQPRTAVQSSLQASIRHVVVVSECGAVNQRRLVDLLRPPFPSSRRRRPRSSDSHAWNSKFPPSRAPPSSGNCCRCAGSVPSADRGAGRTQWPTVVRDARSSRPSCGTHAIADRRAGRTQ